MKYIICALLLFLSLSSPAGDKPNILIFLVDDMGLMDTSVPFLTDKDNNPVTHKLNKFYETPGMKRLADSGLRFTQFYANSVCSPSRASLMTGQSSARHHITQFIKPESNNAGTHGPKNWKWEGLNETDITLPKILKENGYKTIHCGKGHFAPVGYKGENPQNIGFDINIAGCSYGQPGSYFGKENFGNGIKKRQKRAVPGLSKYHGKEIHLSEALTLEMNSAITAAVEEGKPFFAYMSHYAVHAPFQADPRYMEKYKNKTESKNAAAYATLIEGMDKSLNDIIDHLTKLKIADNTLIFFLGDNGSDAPLGPTHSIASSAPLRGKKGTHYEGGMRVPFIVSWAAINPESQIQKKFNITRGILSSHFASINDILPTILDITELKIPENHVIDGASLIPLITGKQLEHKQKFLMHFPHSHRSSYFTVFRSGDYKLIHHYLEEENKKYELFNLKQDPYETQNIAQKNPELLNKMVSEMSQQLKEAKAQLPYNKNGKEIPYPKLQ